MSINFPVQIYSYVFPSPASTDADYFAFKMVLEMLFTDDNSILTNRLVKKEHSAYGFIPSGDGWSYYPNFGLIDVIMNASPGNVKVKKAIREEINRLATEGITQEKLDEYISSAENSEQLNNYECENISAQLGIAEYYLNDFQRAYSMVAELKRVTPEKIKEVTAKYLSEERIQFVNIKPE